MMLALTEKRFSDVLRRQPETGMGYWIATVALKDGRTFPQTVIVGGTITRIRNQKDIPFSEGEIERLEVTHDKWSWSEDMQNLTSRGA